MKRLYWFLLIISAVLYALPFLLNDYFWWLIFIFPVPLLYATREHNLSFIHGYFWGCIVFALHLSGGVYLVADMAGELWVVGLMFGIVMILYQSLVPALFFWSVTLLRSTSFEGQAKSPIICLCLWTIALWLFIIWVDGYCLWIFGVQEGYPLMQPLLLLAQQPKLLYLLPIIGKPLLTGFFLLVPVSIVALLWYRNYAAMLFLSLVMIFWLICLGSKDMRALEDILQQVQDERGDRISKIKSLPYMVCCIGDDPTVIIKIVGNQIKKLITAYPETEIIIMPESAFNMSNFAEIPQLVQLWNEDSLGKRIHLIFGASRWHNDHYYNSLHWVYNGVLQHCYDKKHAMLMSERLPVWMHNDFLRKIYFNERQSIAVSCCERIKLDLLENITFVPYICSELFFNESPDDIHEDIPIIAIINDSLFLGNWWTSYMQKLLVLLARFKAIQWQRDIVYISYAQSLFIDKAGAIQPMMM